MSDYSSLFLFKLTRVWFCFFATKNPDEETWFQAWFATNKHVGAEIGYGSYLLATAVDFIPN